jgi:hypothetical protein
MPFNMAYMPEYETMKFNTVLNFHAQWLVKTSKAHRLVRVPTLGKARQTYHHVLERFAYNGIVLHPLNRRRRA